MNLAGFKSSMLIFSILLLLMHSRSSGMTMTDPMKSVIVFLNLLLSLQDDIPMHVSEINITHLTSTFILQRESSRVGVRIRAHEVYNIIP